MTRNSTVTAITLQQGRRGKRERTRINYYKGDSNIVTQPSSNPAEQGLTFLSRREAVLPLVHRDFTQRKLFHFHDFLNNNKQAKHLSLRLELTPRFFHCKSRTEYNFDM